jgi:hypothetical protein
MGVLEPPEFPQWTVRRGFGKVGGRFPLALEAVGQRMIAMHVLPQVTNATAHPRYYAFFCWVFEQSSNVSATGCRSVKSPGDSERGGHTWNMRCEPVRLRTILRFASSSDHRRPSASGASGATQG